jgi:pyrroline-5-carboxylate reductase
MTLGIIGVGTIAAAVVEGLQSTSASCPIVLSPRNEQRAALLASTFADVQVAPTNQAVLEASEIVIIAVRPQIAHAVLSELRFRPDQRVVSLIPAVTLDYLRSMAAPARSVTRAVPLPSAARGQSPTAMYPPDPSLKALFEKLGAVIELDREEEFEAFTTATAIMSSYFRFAQTVVAWMQREGVSEAKAHAFVSQTLLGLAGAATASPLNSFAELTEQHQTHGGLNEQVLQSLTAAGVFADLEHALDGVLARLVAGRPK